MNRRGFFTRTIGALASAYLAPLLPKAFPGARPVMFKGIPLVFDEHVPAVLFCMEVQWRDGKPTNKIAWKSMK